MASFGCFLLVVMAVRYSASAQEDNPSIITKVKPENVLTSAEKVYDNVPLLSACSQLCTGDSTCWSFSYDSMSQECNVSTDLSNSTSHQTPQTERVLDVTVRTYTSASCRTEYLLPTISDSTINDCIKLTVNSSDDAGESAYRPEKRACYLSVPRLPDGEDSCQVPTTMFIVRGVHGENTFNHPTKLSMTGAITSTASYSGMNRAVAFDGSHGWNNHWLSSSSGTNPWVGRDIGAIRTIAGAKFWARTNCCASQVTNLHFSAVLEESEFSNYDESLCSVYPGPPEYPLMAESEVMWLPCSFRQARYIRMTVYKTGMIGVSEIEVFGFL